MTWWLAIVIFFFPLSPLKVWLEGDGVLLGRWLSGFCVFLIKGPSMIEYEVCVVCVCGVLLFFFFFNISCLRLVMSLLQSIVLKAETFFLFSPWALSIKWMFWVGLWIISSLWLLLSCWSLIVIVGKFFFFYPYVFMLNHSCPSYSGYEVLTLLWISTVWLCVCLKFLSYSFQLRKS